MLIDDSRFWKKKSLKMRKKKEILKKSEIKKRFQLNIEFKREKKTENLLFVFYLVILFYLEMCNESTTTVIKQKYFSIYVHIKVSWSIFNKISRRFIRFFFIFLTNILFDFHSNILIFFFGIEELHPMVCLEIDYI